MQHTRPSAQRLTLKGSNDMRTPRHATVATHWHRTEGMGGVFGDGRVGSSIQAHAGGHGRSINRLKTGDSNAMATSRKWRLADGHGGLVLGP